MTDKAYILSVDDEEINRDIMVDILEDEFEIESVTNGRECLDSIEERIPDVILLDVNMPVMNGLEVCKHLREHHIHKDIKIILVSALAMASQTQEGLDAGADKYITKPFDEDDLKNTICDLLELSS